MEKQTSSSPTASSTGFGHEHAAQERRIVLTVGAFFLLAVAMWLTNKYFGPAELQSNLVVSGDFGIGTDRKVYSAGSGATIRVPIQVEYPAGQRLSSVRIALSPWPKTATKPTFALSSGTSAVSSVTMTGSGTVVLSLDNITLPPSNLGEVGSFEFTTSPGTLSSMIGLISNPSDPQGTMITTAGLGGKKQEARLSSPDFFRLETTAMVVPSTGSGASGVFRPAAGSVFTLPDLSSLVKRFFGIATKQGRPAIAPSVGSGSQIAFKSPSVSSGSDLRGAAPAGRAPTTGGTDLAVEIQVPTDRVETGKASQARAILRNDGNTKATNAKFSLTIPEQLRVVIGSFSREGCSATAQAVACSFASLAGGQIISVPIDLLPTATGNFPLQTTVRADQTETNNANNQAKATVLVVKATAPTVTPSPSPTAKPTSAPKPQATGEPIGKLPQTGPLPLGITLFATGITLLFAARRMYR